MFKGYWVLFYTIEKLVNAIGYNTYLAVNFKKKNISSIKFEQFIDIFIDRL